MKNVLIPVDGSANSLRAVHYMIDHVREHGACNLHLLNVQPPIVSGTVLAFVSSDMIQEYYEDEARTALADAGSRWTRQASCISRDCGSARSPKPSRPTRPSNSATIS